MPVVCLLCVTCISLYPQFPVTSAVGMKQVTPRVDTVGLSSATQCVIARAGVSGLSSPCPPRRSLSQGSTNAVVLDVAQTGGHKKRVCRSSFLNAKKLYKDTQMARKVKQYLSNLELEMDEKSLQMLSLQCEPATSTRESPPLPRWLWASCRQQLRGRGAEQELLRLSLSQVRGPCRRTLRAPRAAFSLTTAYPVSSAIWSDCVPLGRCLPWGG